MLQYELQFPSRKQPGCNLEISVNHIDFYKKVDLVGQIFNPQSSFS